MKRWTRSSSSASIPAKVTFSGSGDKQGGIVRRRVDGAEPRTGLDPELLGQRCSGISCHDSRPVHDYSSVGWFTCYSSILSRKQGKAPGLHSLGNTSCSAFSSNDAASGCGRCRFLRLGWRSSSETCPSTLPARRRSPGAARAGPDLPRREDVRGLRRPRADG